MAASSPVPLDDHGGGVSQYLSHVTTEFSSCDNPTDDLQQIDMGSQNSSAALTIAAPGLPQGEFFHDNRLDSRRPYKCPSCDRAFHRLEHRQRHMRTHTREKPHLCQFPACARRFSRPDELTRHSRIHNRSGSSRSSGGSSYSIDSNGSTLSAETGPRTPPEYSFDHLPLHIRGYVPPAIHNLSSQTTYALIPKGPKILDCYGQNHTNAQSFPASSAVKSGLSVSDIISRTDDTQRKLPVLQLPEVIVQDCLAALGTGFNASAESDTTGRIAGDMTDAMSEAGNQNNMLSKAPNELPQVEEIAPASQSDSGSSNWEDETDWGEDDNCVSEEQIQHFGLTDTLDEAARSISQILVKPILNQTQAELVDLLMDEFWAVITQNSGTNTAAHGASSSTSPSQNTQSTSEKSSKPKSRSRTLENDEDGDIGEDDREGPKRQKLGSSSPILAVEINLFACPYRKYDPRKYNVRDWATCALTPHRTVARVKGHLYRHHIIHLCPRCKTLFQSSGDLDEHILAPTSCALSTSPPAEGITSKMKEQLQCRKKTHQGQSEAERWQQIYQIIFPAEIVPSPYFEPVRDHDNDEEPRSPDSRELTRYEGFLRRELPRYFRNVLETAVQGEVRSIEERLRGDLMNLLDQARNHALSDYRATSVPVPEISLHLSQPAEQTLGENARATTPRMDISGTTMLETFYQPPPPSAYPGLSLDLSDFITEMEPADPINAMMNNQNPLPVPVQKVHDNGWRPATNSSFAFGPYEPLFDFQPQDYSSSQSQSLSEAENPNNSWLSNGQITQTSTSRTSHHRESSLSSLGSAGPSSPYTANTSNPQIVGEPYHDFSDLPPLAQSPKHFTPLQYSDFLQDVDLTCKMAQDELSKNTGNDDLIPAP